MRNQHEDDTDPRTVRGSFSLWLKRRFHPFLRACAEYLVKRIGVRNVRGIFLCGSFASGEGSVVFETEGPMILSDIDLVVVFESLESMKACFEMRSDLGEACERLMPEARFAGHVEIGIFLPESLRSLPPRPGVFEMKAVGQMLYGDGAVLDLIPTYEPAEIGGREAVILIENRIISLIGALPEISGKAQEGPYPFLYEVARVYTDIATAALCLTGSYRLGYQQRWDLLHAAVDGQGPDLLKRLIPGDFMPKIGKWTSFKVSPSIENLGIALHDRSLTQLWDDCGRDILMFWRKAEAYVQNADVSLANPPPPGALLTSRKRSGRWIDHYRNWNWYLAGLPRSRRIPLLLAVGRRILSEDPIEMVREHGVRLIDRQINRGGGGSVPSPPGGFPHRGGMWKDAAASLVSTWREIVFGRKDS